MQRAATTKSFLRPVCPTESFINFDFAIGYFFALFL
jgi:hypothetical protein